MVYHVLDIFTISIGVAAPTHSACCYLHRLGNPVEISFGLFLMSLSSKKPFKQLQIKVNSISWH